MPKVSVIVPVHNTAQYLNKCIKSITNQTLKDIEIILVENGSTDNSLELCHGIASTDERIKVLHIEEGDLSKARNEGVKIATGEYMAFIDSDDTILPTMYEDMYTLANKYDLGMVNSNFCRTYDNKENVYPFSQSGEIRIVSAKEMVTLAFLGKIPNSACVNLFKKTLFDNLQFPEFVNYEDRASVFLFMSQCGRGAVIFKAYYNYYQRKGSIIHTKEYKQYHDHILADCKRLEFIIESGMFEDNEKPIVAKGCAKSLLRKLGHLLITNDDEHKEEVRELCRKIVLIPQETQLTFKTRLIKRYIEKRIL